MTKLILIADPHVLPPGAAAHGIRTFDRLAQACDDIARRHADADACLFLGDLTEDAAPASYGAFADLRDRLGLPVHLSVGNHDARAAFLAAFPETPHTADGFVQFAVRVGDLRLVVLDSVEPGVHDGNLCDRRLSWLDACLGEDRQTPTLVALHHHPWPLGMAVDDCMLRQPERLAAVVGRHPQVRLMVSGHVHCGASGLWHGIAFASIAATNYTTAHHQAAKGEQGDRLTQPVSYTILTAAAGQILLQSHFFAAAGTLLPAASPAPRAAGQGG